MNNTFDFFYGGEADQYSFYRIPRALVTGERFRGVSTDAKLLYGLIHRKKQGQGKPARIYVKRFTTQEDRPEALQNQPSTAPVSDFSQSSCQNADNQKSVKMKTRSADFSKSSPNYTYVNQPYSSQLYPSIHPPGEPPLDRLDKMDGCDMRERVKEQIGYDLLTSECGTDDADELVELITDVYCTTRPTLRVGGEDRPTAQVWERYQRLDYSHIKYVLDALSQNTSKVRNIRAYLLTRLYNAPATIGRYYQAEVQHDMYGGP